MKWLLVPALLLAAAGEASSIQIDHPWARPTPGGAKNGAAYMTIAEKGSADRLIGVTTPVAETAELHDTIDDKGVMKMRPAGGLALESGKSVAFAPGGRHIMLRGLKVPLQVGDTFPLTLRFEHAAPVTVTVTVEHPSGEAGLGHRMH
jgi:copper(I)-binding protein